MVGNHLHSSLKTLQVKPTYCRELVAECSAIKHFRHILEGHTCTVFTDHKPFIYVFQQKRIKLPPIKIDEVSFIAQFTTDIQYAKGTENVVAVALYRMYALTNTTFDLNILQRAQQCDPEKNLLMMALRSSNCNQSFITVSIKTIRLAKHTKRLPYVGKSLATVPTSKNSPSCFNSNFWFQFTHKKIWARPSRVNWSFSNNTILPLLFSSKTSSQDGQKYGL